MKQFKSLVLFTFLIMKFSTSFAQIDTVFWFAPPWVTPDHWWKDDVKFHISTFNNATTIRIRQPASSYDTTFTVAANKNFNFNYWLTSTKGFTTNPTSLGFDSLETRPANVVRTNGFKITSNFPITVVFDYITRSTQFLNPETFSLKGRNGLGTEFVCPFQTKWNNKNLTNFACPTPATLGQGGRDLNCDGVLTQPKQQINIVATSYNTIVWITPKCNVVGHTANVTYSVFLPNPGDAYTVENAVQTTSTIGNNLSGSVVVSNKPIAVTVADDSVNPGNISGVTSCFDLMGDQIVPVDVVGKNYIINKGQLNGPTGEAIFIVGTQNFTQITIDDGTATTYTINKGDTKMFNIVNPLTSVVAAKNVYVFHASGYGCELGAAVLPPLNCAGSNQVAFSRNNNQPFSLNVMCKNGVQGTFTLSSSTTTSLIPAASFTIVPGTSNAYVGAQINFSTTQIIPDTSYRLSNSADVFAMGVINGDVTTGGLYHYMSSFKRTIYTDAGTDVSYCTGTNSVISLAGTVSGGASTGIWSVVSGTTSIGLPAAAYTSTLTNINANYTLTPTDTTKSQIKLVLLSTGNCDNVADTMVINIRKSPAVEAGPNITQCKNNISPINLNGSVLFATGGNWTSTGTGVFGNPTTFTTSYTPSPADLSAGSVKIKLTSAGSVFGCPNTSDSLMITFTNAPTVTAGADINVCTNSPTVNLTGLVSGPTLSGLWTTNGSGAFMPSDTLMNTTYVLSPNDLALSTGSLVITLTSQNNGLCNAVTDNITVFITQKPYVNAGSNDTICASAGAIALTGTVSGSASLGVWSTTGSGSFLSTTSFSTVYTMSAADTLAGSVQIILTSSGGICNPETDTVTYVILKAPFVDAGKDTSICNNTIIPLGGNVTGFTTSGQWTSTGTGTFSPNNTALSGSYFPSLADLANGSVKLVLESTNNKGCNAQRDTMLITFKPAPIADFSYSIACATKPIQFNNTSGGTISGYNWNFGDGGTAISQNPIHSYSVANTYTVSFIVSSANGCLDTIQKPVSVYNLPFADFNFTAACEKQLIHFLDTSLASSGDTIVKWNWNFADGGLSTAVNPTHTYTLAGIYNVSLFVTTDKGCSDSINQAINVRPRPTAYFSMTNNPTLAQEIVYFTDFSTPSSTINYWNWEFGDGVGATAQNPTHVYNNQGTYTVTLIITDNFGCSDTSRRDISVTLLPMVPTAFSPNSDNNNDFLFVKGGPFEKMLFRVYNNWGELIFETNDQSVGWDGTYKGQEAPIGVYVWVLDVDMFNNKSVRKTGDVTLLR